MNAMDLGVVVIVPERQNLVCSELEIRCDNLEFELLVKLVQLSNNFV